MAHFPKPFFRPKKNRWYVQLDGKHVNLGPDEEEAWVHYHELMAARGKEPKVPPPPPPKAVRAPEDIPVVSVLDLFLEWCENHRAQLTLLWYQERCQWFVKTIPGSLTVG